MDGLFALAVVVPEFFPVLLVVWAVPFLDFFFVDPKKFRVDEVGLWLCLVPDDFAQEIDVLFASVVTPCFALALLCWGELLVTELVWFPVF